MPQETRSPDVVTRVQVAPRVTRESQELLTLETQRGELRGQLSTITERRALLSAQLHDSEGQTRVDLNGRIRTLDARTAAIEDQLNAIDDRVSALVARGVRPPPSGFDRLMEGAFPGRPGAPGAVGFAPADPFKSEWGVLFGGMVLMQGLTLVLLGIVVWRSFVRRTFARLGGEDANRFEQLQRSVDVMAVEVERIAESQRFTAKLLNEQSEDAGRAGKEAERVR
jgi:hypothetical protein